MQDDDWNLPGQRTDALTTRTRGGGSGRPDLARKEDVVVAVVDDTTEAEAVAVAEEEEEEEEEDDEDEEEAPADKCKKPKHTRVLVEVAQLEGAFAGRACPECHECLELKLRTVCIATSIDLVCNNKD